MLPLVRSAIDYLYTTDIGLGRVVETPAEIVDALETYVTFDGTLDIATATVLGYDFLVDGSVEIAATLDANWSSPSTMPSPTADPATAGPRTDATHKLPRRDRTASDLAQRPLRPLPGPARGRRQGRRLRRQPHRRAGRP